jgi:hypothetical protein
MRNQTLSASDEKASHVNAMPTSSVPVLIEVTEEFSATIYRVRGK